MRNCLNHPERPAAALCMSCQKALCQECATRWEGIHYCVECLEARRGGSAAKGALGPWLLVAAACLALLALTSALRVVVGIAFGALF